MIHKLSKLLKQKQYTYLDKFSIYKCYSYRYSHMNNKNCKTKKHSHKHLKFS